MDEYCRVAETSRDEPRHGFTETTGATLGVAQLLLSKNVVNYLRNDASHVKTLENTWNLVYEIEAKRLYRGKGGEIMRGAVCNVIESLGRVATLPSSSSTSPSDVFKPSKQLFVQLCESATSESLRHPKKGIREAAAKALVSIATASAQCVEKRKHHSSHVSGAILVNDRLRIMRQTMGTSEFVLETWERVYFGYHS